MPTKIEEEVAFLQTIPFFAHWTKKKLKSLVGQATTVSTHRGEILQTEGVANDAVFIIKSGQFQAIRKTTTDIPAKPEHERVKEFLQGTQAKRSVRGIFNNKISRITHKRGLTKKTIHRGNDDVSILGKGQLFGEGRFIEVYQRMVREEQRKGKEAAQRGAGQQMKLPLELEDDDSAKAPYTVKCVSMGGELSKIKGADFFRLVLKEKNTTQ